MARIARRRSALPLLLAVAVAVASLAAAAENDSGALPPSVGENVPGATLLPNDTIASYLQSRTDTAVLLAAGSLLPNLTNQLASPAARFTAFAPTDAAFANLARRLDPTAQVDQNDPSSVISVLATALARLRNLSSAKYIDLRGFIMYHLIGEALSSRDLEKRFRVVTMSGQRLRFTDGVIIDGDNSRGNVSASPRDVFVSNGWVNIINEVLLPFNLSRALADLARTTPSPSASNTPTPVPPTTSSSPAASTPPTDPSATATTSGPVTVDSDDPEASADVGEGPDPSQAAGDPVESPEEEDSGPACFPADASVTLGSGEVVRMKDLAAGHAIRVSHDASVPASKVFLFTHRSAATPAMFYTLTTASGHAVTLTGGHYVYASGSLVAAQAVRVGDVLRTAGGDSPVTRVTHARGQGLFAPHTVHGDLIVDGVAVSGYSTAVHPKLAHALLMPVRALASYAGVTEPLGGLMYNGADSVAELVPGGRNRY